MRIHACLECGSPMEKARKGQDFCGKSCRQTFNNRRLQRGAEVYDLFRAMRRERADAKEMNIWTEMCRLEKKWQEEDDRKRPGRRSYMPLRKALENLYDKGSLPRGEVLAHNFRAGR